MSRKTLLGFCCAFAIATAAIGQTVPSTQPSKAVSAPAVAAPAPAPFWHLSRWSFVSLAVIAAIALLVVVIGWAVLKHTKDWKMIVVSGPLAVFAVVVAGWAVYGMYCFCSGWLLGH